MRVFISDRDTAKLYVQFLDQNNPKCGIELIYDRDFEAVQNNLTTTTNALFA